MNSLSFRAQKATRQLDQMSKEFTEPIESWFWPKVIKEPTEETDIDLEEPKIKDVTNEDEEQVNAEDNLQGIRYENDFFQVTILAILLQICGNLLNLNYFFAMEILFTVVILIFHQYYFNICRIIVRYILT